MISLKQMEALFWIAELGTFERAAARLNTTQSAISKRIQELELAVDFLVFDRTRRGARQLTVKGEHLLEVGKEMLALQERVIDLRTSGETPSRRLRIGVTELTALTWFPKLIVKIRELYPNVMLEPHVDTARALAARLDDDELDLIVVPDGVPTDEVACIQLAEVSNNWMARPGLVDASRILRMDEIARLPTVTQGTRSGTGAFYNRWFRSQGVMLPQVLTTDNLMALVGFTVAGLGISYLPSECLRPFVEQGKLVIVGAYPPLPAIPYSVAYRHDRPSAFAAKIAELTRDVCDFSQQLQS